MKTGSIKFDSIPQRLNMALTISLLIACASSLQQLIVGPEIATPSGEPQVYRHLMERMALLAFLALWGMKLFVDDNQCLVPGKGAPSIDVIFIILSHGALICSAAFITRGNLALHAVLAHFCFLFLWNFVAIFFKERASDVPKWLVIDGIVASALILLNFNDRFFISNLWVLVLLFAVLAIDTALSKTLKEEFLVGTVKNTSN